MKPHYKLNLNGKVVRLQRRPPAPTFMSILLRLKVQLGVSKNKAVAKELGFSEKAFAARKRRESFPINELHILAAKLPELKLDTAYILTGVHKAASASAA